tara:strand:- start:4193 stop:4942 length:750 start_codon:yes stop_codon:yes gene_type:complete
MLVLKKAFLVVAVLVGALYAGRLVWGEVAYWYFQYKCNTQAGEFIHKTVENVEGVYQMRLRDPRDYIDRMRRGDIPEDPFGHTNVEAQEPWTMFVGVRPEYSYRFFETTLPPRESLQRTRNFRFENDPNYTGEKYWRYRRLHDSNEDAEHNNMTAEQTSVIESDYGFTWREIRNRWDRLFNVYGGELAVVEFANKEELAIRRGFVLFSKFGKRTGICPRDKAHFITAIFLRKVLIPAANYDNKSLEGAK